MSDFGFLIDITGPLNELNKKLQGREHLIHQLFQLIYSFEMKLRLWEDQLRNFNYAHFPTLHKPASPHAYVTAIATLRQQFADRFTNIRARNTDIMLFSNPFNVRPDDIPAAVQLELIEMQCSDELKTAFKEVPILEFYRTYLPAEEYPERATHARCIASLFGSTYTCEQLFYKMNFIKCKTRSQLTHEHLDGLLRLAATSIPTDMDRLVAQHQHQVSH